MAAQIIQFPVQHSNGYNNLIQLFEICDSLESCNFYLEDVYKRQALWSADI